LLKKLVPFALTFVVGSAIGGLFNSFGSRSTPAFGGLGPSYRFERRYSCRMHARDLVAETKPLVILFKPVVHLSGVFGELWRVRVTFGADGKVQAVEPLGGWEHDTYIATVPRKWEAIENAARQIQFTPETVDGIPVTVTREVNIELMPE
jgi:hypothetical protein